MTSDNEDSVKFGPEEAEGFYNLGRFSAWHNDPEKTIEYYDRALKIKPDYAEALRDRGIAKCELGQYKEALKDYNAAIALSPNDAEAYYHRGNVQRRLGQHDEVLKDYDAALELNPDYAEAYFNRGLAKMHAGRQEEASRDLARAGELEPELNAILAQGIMALNSPEALQSHLILARRLGLSVRDWQGLHKDRQKEVAGGVITIVWIAVGVFLFASNDNASVLSWQAAVYFFVGTFVAAVLIGWPYYLVERGIVKICLLIPRRVGYGRGNVIFLKTLGLFLMIAFGVLTYYVADFVISEVLFPVRGG